VEIESVVRKYIADNLLLGETDGLGATQSLLGSGIIDSTGVLDLVMFLEKTFGIEVLDEDMVPENLDSISNIARFVERKSQSLRAGSEVMERQADANTRA